MKPHRKYCRALCLLLLLAFVFALCPLSAIAAEELVILIDDDNAAPTPKVTPDDTVELIEVDADGALIVLPDNSGDTLLVAPDDEVLTESGPYLSDAAEDAAPDEVSDNVGGKPAIGFYAELNGNLDLYLTLRLHMFDEPAAYCVGVSGNVFLLTDRDAAGNYVVPVLTHVQPHQIANTADIWVMRGQTVVYRFSYSVLTYLRQVLGDFSPSSPNARPVYTGAINGVSDYRAKLEQDSTGTRVRLYFRTDDASGLSFSCSGHSVSAPVREGSDLWSVALGGVQVNELPADFVITGVKDAQTVTLRFSPFSYAAMHWGDTDMSLIVLCRALAAVLP